MGVMSFFAFHKWRRQDFSMRGSSVTSDRDDVKILRLQ